MCQELGSGLGLVRVGIRVRLGFELGLTSTGFWGRLVLLKVRVRVGVRVRYVRLFENGGLWESNRLGLGFGQIGIVEGILE